MSYKLIIFPTPLDAHCDLRHDADGVVRVAVPDTHPTGRPGQSFDLPTGLPNGNGARLTISAPKKVTLVQRGILYFNDGVLDYPWTPSMTAAFSADDFILADEKECPPPQPPNPPQPSGSPLDMINQMYATGKFNLATKSGCGLFTEACCKVLHENHSPSWGHLRKTGAQNQFNGHAVDAIQLLVPELNCEAFIYDIITDSESPNAHPALNVAGAPEPSLFLYPPKPIL